MSGANSPLHCKLTLLVAKRGRQKKTKTKDTMSLDYSSICYIGPRIGWVSMKEIYKSSNYSYGTYSMND